MSEPIRVEVSVTEEDYRAAAWAIPRIKGRRQSRAIPRACVGAIAVGLFLCFLSWQGQGENLLGGALLFLFGGAVLYIWVSQAHRAAEQGWREYAKGAEPTTYEFAPGGVTTTMNSMAAQYRWTAFERVHTSADVYLLVRNIGGMLILPKRCFLDDAQRQAFAQLVREQLPVRTGAFPVIPLKTEPEGDPPLSSGRP